MNEIKRDLMKGMSLSIVIGAFLGIAFGYITGCSCEEKEEPVLNESAFPEIPDLTVQIKSVTRPSYKDSTWNTIFTTEHDGHLFICLWPNYLMHHPDCPCLKQVKFEEN